MILKRPFLLLLAVAVLSILLPVAGSADDDLTERLDTLPKSLPNGVAAGDATQNRVVLWARTTMSDGIFFKLPGGGTVWQRSKDGSVPHSVTVSGLAPGIAYTYSVLDSSGNLVSGRFKSPASIGEYTGLRFGVGGDLLGDLSPFPALNNGVEQDLDFFIALGDTVYADIRSPSVSSGSARTLDEYRRKHAEALAERGGENALTTLRANTLFYAMIDDHEIADDFAGGAPASSDSRFTETDGYVNDTTRFENGMQAFEEYYPIHVERYSENGGDEVTDGERKLYRYRTFGSDAAIFLLDSRTFRNAPVADPTGPADLDRFYDEVWTPGRSLLGKEQLTELKRDLLHAEQSDITWKFVVVPQPVQIIGPLGASDRFEGYAAERADLLRFIHFQQLSNVVFIAADVHGTIINNVTFRTQRDGPVIQMTAFEVTTGPLAQPAVIGPRIVGMSHGYGWLSASDLDFYETLPIAPDMDDTLDDRDDVVKDLLNNGLTFLGEDPVGLDGSPINATLLAGDYLVTHNYNWTEFDIDQKSQALTVTTYGSPVYTPTDLANNLATITKISPEIVSQFRVEPTEPEEASWRKQFLPVAAK